MKELPANESTLKHPLPLFQVVRAFLHESPLPFHYAELRRAGMPGGAPASGVGAGRLDVFYVGGGYKRWAHVPTGDPISQLKDAVENAEPGRLAVSPEAWELLQRGAENVQGTPCDQGVVRARMMWGKIRG